ncbi:hypothetical protein GRI40_06815 [Altererythrobacter aerius]|uniref:Inositolphosphotransferase Aur1/Ipt1 domain-containing protein n=2 Tax=Tsuneonella aeria TaxID=1837929 RepID=A0A6I4TC73_9SPHN|nr:hypothetical protein [Tsuneonella aeria]
MRLALAPVIPLGSNFYMFGFIAMFYLAFAWHALQSRAIFRELIVSAMLLQILGSLAYLVAPALGPFLYEPGVEPPVSGAQAYMLEAWHANRDGGAAWLRDHGSGSLTVGLAAMPSLHAGGSFLFVIFAWRHARPLLAVMLPLFAYILVAAVATRWHYVVDLPVGIALAWCAAALARRLLRAETARAGAVAEQPSPIPVPPGLPAPAE